MKIITWMAGVAAGALLASSAYAYGADGRGEVIRDHPVVHGVVAKATGRACPEEDSVNCFWNARTMGNGHGHSFYSVRVGHKVCHIYWSGRFNRREGGCA